MKKSVIQQARDKMRENRVYIDKTIDLTDLQSKELIFESGCKFLEKTYGHSPKYVEHSRSKVYWNWYRLQWYGVEESFIHFLRRNNRRRPQSMMLSQYADYMDFYCVNSNRIDEAFKNYLKSIR